MGKKKSRNTSTAQYQQLPLTSQQQQYSNAVNQGIDLSSPIIHGYAKAGENVENQLFENELPADIRNRIKASQMFNLNVDKGAALSSARGQEQAWKTGQLGNVAAMTAPRQTGGTTYGEQWGYNFADPFMGGLGGSLGTGLGAAV